MFNSVKYGVRQSPKDFFHLFCVFTSHSSSFQAKIQTIQGHARFTSDPEPTVEVNGKKYTAPHILIATGGQPSVLCDDEVPGETYSTQMIIIVIVCLLL